MQQNLPQELMASHALLSNLEIELAKDRNSLIQHCNGKPIYAASYYPVLEHYYSLTDQYVAELSNFRKLLQSVEQQQAPPMSTNTASNEASIVVPSSVPDTSSSTAMRKIATSMNGNYSSNAAATMDDSKQPEVIPPSSSLHVNNVNLMNNNNNSSNPNGDLMNNQSSNAAADRDMDSEMKVTALYSEEQPAAHPAQRTLPRKPPVKSSSSSAATMAMMNPDGHEQDQQHLHHGMPMTTASYVSAPPHSHSQHALAHSQAAAPQALRVQSMGGGGAVKPRSQLKVQRHKYKYEGRGFQIWRQNLQRPIYTATTLRLSRKFGADEKQIRFTGDERQVRKFLVEKGGFRPEFIEQITFIAKRDANGQSGKVEQKRGQRLAPNQIDFIIVRVRASLQYIFQCIDQIEKQYGSEVIKKQNNRSKTNSNSKNCAKLYVNNFDILDESTHRNLTKIFVRYGELEQDIFVGRDKKQNPYALVQFRDARDAQRCVRAHGNYQSTIFFPPRENSSANDNDGDSPSNRQRFFNRKLHIEYVSDNNEQNSARKQPSNRSRRGGRGGRRQ